MIKKIVLIIPKDHVAVEPLVYPPLGLLYIASILENEGYEVLIHDMREDNVLEHIPYCENYGITSSTPQIYESIKISKYLRNIYKSYVVIGGHYASYEYQKIENDFDAIVVGEGESLIVDILKEKKKGIIKSDLKNLMYIDDIPFPARHLLPKERVVNEDIISGYGYKGNNLSTTIMTTRGCPNRCAFCSNIPQKVRFRNPEKVIEEIELLKNNYGCKSFKLLDDDFLLKFKHMEEICLSLKHMNVEYRCATRSDNIDEKKCKLLKESGCVELALGIEVADNDILKNMHKRETIEQHEKAIKIIKDNGLLLRYYLMVGLPGQNQDSIKKTKDFLLKNKPDRCTISTFIPYPGCEIWREPKKFGVEIEKDKWDNYFQLYPTEPPYRTKECSKEEIKNQQKELLDFLEEIK